MPDITELSGILSVVIAFAAVCASIYAIRQARKTALTGAYFSEMALAYSAYLQCATDFAHRRGLKERDDMTAAFYRLSLFASEAVLKDATGLYHFLIAWAQEGILLGVQPGNRLEKCQELMRNDLEMYRRHGHH